MRNPSPFPQCPPPLSIKNFNPPPPLKNFKKASRAQPQNHSASTIQLSGFKALQDAKMAFQMTSFINPLPKLSDTVWFSLDERLDDDALLTQEEDEYKFMV